MSRLAIVEITNDCNCNCKYCYESAYRNRKSHLTNEDFEKIFSYDFLYSDMILSGGEVFTHPDWKGIFKSLIRHNKSINIMSNGSYIKKFIAEQISVESMTISLDSFMAKYNILRSNNILCNKDDIIMLINSKLVKHIYIQVILNKISIVHENLSDIFSFCEQYKIGLKLKYMDDYPYNGTKKYILSEEEINSINVYLKEKKKQYHFDLEMPSEEGNVFCKCEVLHGTSNIRFRSDGRIFLCEKLDDEDFSIGTIGDSEEILKKNYENVRARLMYRIINMTMGECSNCIYNFKCNKGCPVLLDCSSNEKCIKGIKK